MARGKGVHQSGVVGERQPVTRENRTGGTAVSASILMKGGSCGPFEGVDRMLDNQINSTGHIRKYDHPNQQITQIQHRWNDPSPLDKPDIKCLSTVNSR